MKKRVLLVDDEISREVFRIVLESSGCEVVEAASGYKAIDILSKEHFDAIVSDAIMSDGSGFDLLAWIRKNAAFATPFLLVTGFSDFSIEDAYHQGVDGVLQKPLQAENLQEAVDTLLVPLDIKLSWKERFHEGVSQSLLIDTTSKQIPTSGGLAVGRGGMFVASSNMDFVPHEIVDFEVLDVGKQSLLRGQGIVRWVRKIPQNGLLQGFGIEFSSLDSASVERLGGFISSIKPIPFIPRGES